MSPNDSVELPSNSGAESEAEHRQFRQSLLTWFDTHQRSLPWRHVDDPYAVWVSEIMLQQTQVSTVVDYFERWMERFPTVERLAQASIEEVLELWSGLGYYRRARYLHRGAAQVVDKYGGRLPDEVSELKKLPGIGPYTAGAIASIAFGKPEALVDGNVMRVMARLYAIEGDPKRAPANRRIWDRARALVDPERPGDFNQGLMELGSEVCVSAKPRCMICPVRSWCVGFATGAPQRFPATEKRVEQTPMRARCAVVYRRHNGGRQFLLRRRPAQGLLGGLWEFPSCEREGKSWPRCSALEERLAEVSVGSPPTVTRAMGTVEHVFSHRRLKMRVHDLDLTEWEGQWETDRGDWRWVRRQELSEVAAAALLRKVEACWDAES